MSRALFSIPVCVVFLALVGCRPPAQNGDRSSFPGERDQSPITPEDRLPPFKYLTEPLAVGAVGMPYTFEVISASDESHLYAKMTFSNGECGNCANEKVWAYVPTAGLVSDHGYYLTTDGPILASISARYKTLRAFKVTGTTTLSNGVTVFKVKPVS